MSKYWKTVSFWTKIKMLVAACGAGGELTLVLQQVDAKWHVLTIVATVISLFLTQFIEDKDNDGNVDALQGNKRKPHAESKQI
jgi:hypothetical protein